MNKFEVHIVEHCNLKCKSCDNYSSIADPEFTSEEIFENDMKRMSFLFKDIQTIRLLGGEPLLHPNINFFLKTTRCFFKDSEIRLTTNAILLNKMSESFWICCHDNNIIIEYTYYPINLDREYHKKLSKKYDVKLVPTFDNYIEEKTIYRCPINDKKINDVNYNFHNCFHAIYKCISLKNGKIYPCTCVPNIYHFNKFFNKHLEVTDNDYINIYEHTAEEIDDFLNKPIPFCGYCNIKNRTYNHTWETTKYNINEWFDI